MLRRLLLSVCSLALLFSLLLSAAGVRAEIPLKINYQARLTDPVSGEPLSGSYDLEFRLYDAATAGDLLWWEAQTVDMDSLGIGSAILGSETEIHLAFEGPVWLEVVIDGEILAPRREIVSVPFAFHAAASDSAVVCNRAAVCDSLAGCSPAAYVLWDSLGVVGTVNDPANPIDWTRLKNVPPGLADGTDNDSGDAYSLDAADGDPTDAVYVDEEGYVGMGTTDPQSLVHIHGGASGATPDSGSELVVEDDGNARISLLSPNDAYPGLLFGDPEDNMVGWLIYNHGADRLRIGVNDADRLTITGDGNVGIGTSTPSEKVEVEGTVKAVVSEEYARAVIGEATAAGDQVNVGGYFLAQGDSGMAVYGEAPSTSNQLHYGGYFKGAGVFGRGVYGESSELGVSFGVGGHFVGVGDNAKGVWGIATAEGAVMNMGGYFSSAGDMGRGVFAVATSEAASTNYGGYFSASGSEGRGVYGGVSGSYGIGVRGRATGTYGTGVYGVGTGTWGHGVIGVIENNSSNASAVLGDATGYANAYAGYFKGKVHVSGTLSKTGGTFVIDHPGDPENKILRHAFAESPEMLLIYKGRAGLDGGVATVTLPGYFEALVHPQGREIALTCINGYTPLYLDGQIEDGRFTVRTVAGGAANQEFSWVIYGVRNDVWAQQNPVVVEEDKTPAGEFKAGEYLNPEAFGISAEPARVPAEELLPPERGWAVPGAARGALDAAYR